MDAIRLASEHFFAGLRALNDADLNLAEMRFLKALELAPDRPSVLTNLSIVYSQQNRLAEALELSRIAVEKDPSEPLYWLQHGAVQLKLRDYNGALVSLLRALERNPSLAEAHNNRGGALKELNRLDEALASYDQAIGLRPDYADAYSNRGVVLKALGRLDEALASYDRAIDLKPGHAEAHRNRGAALKELDRLDEALASFDRAINLKPDDALAWLGIADIKSETGQFEDAEVGYRKARSLDPRAVAPLCGIAEVKRFEATDGLIEEFESLLSNGSLSDEERSQLHHAYAKVSNDLGRYDDAMNHFALGKSLMKSTFSVEGHCEAYAAMKRLFTPEFFADRADFGLPDERPVFIVGMPRSGTTLTEQILASHQLVDGLGELNDLPDTIRKWCGKSSDPLKFANSVLNLKPADVIKMAERYLEAYRRSSKQSPRIIDKLPHNYEWLGMIALMFPRAHLIHCRRDPLDNCVSMYMQKFRESHGYNQDFAILGRYYREYTGLMNHWSAVLPLPIYDLAYEDIVGDLEASSRSMVSYLGLEWDSNCLAYHRSDRRIDTPSRWQVRQPLYDRSVGRWRRYEEHLGALMTALEGADVEAEK